MKIPPLLLTVLLAGTFVFIGCGSRRNMARGYGESVRKAFSAQVVKKQPPPAGALPAGLDPDDARIVNENYRVTMTRKGAEKKAAPGIIVVDEEEDSRAARRRRSSD